ncbi:retron St85 family RNA-directed DNA polymerase [Nitrosomonas oligotropha]|uniref:RNA-directed DNA polymerase n=1 Tax=Nitrosomonas oligotropha TaxID=42354 RepID=A0A1H8U7A2_9PROT|nr:retron St85 family RNA-directed DNA polymerase [Nitrosomonas oligotropha]SDX42356.1 Retron-type reverse transcriptase [Nitrosomonas oligotropha]SEO99035.1 Retron-type reverse transcriptase [Nitrosomonas oligotropha]
MDLILQLANDLGLANRDILLIANSAPYRYKEYKIPKKKPNTFRDIAQPAREVKILQRWVIENVLTKLPIHNAATAYIKDRNIKYNAMLHAGNPFVLKMDFSNFFPSIVPKDFKTHLLRHLPNMYTEDEINLLLRILFWRNKKEERFQLSIGGPSSPNLSNSIMFEFDSLISDECNSLNIVYSRYADDLVFSSIDFDLLKRIHNQVAIYLKKIPYPKLTLNNDKTMFLSKRGNRTVTGVIITNDGSLSLGRDRKREISCQINWHKKGNLKRSDTLKLHGMLCFANDIEPGFIDRMRTKYGIDTIHELIHLDTSKDQKTIKI